MSCFRRTSPIWAAALLGAALYFFLLGSYPLTDRDEGEYAGVVAAMQRSGDYVVPTLKSAKTPYLEKPILVFWLVAGSQKAFGANEFATRLPSAAALLLLAALGALTLKITKDVRTAAYATAFLALSPLFVLTARTCLTDMPLTLATTLTLLLFFLATEEEGSVARRRGYYCLAWAALSVGFLAKGPVAPAVTMPAAIAYAFFQGRLKRTILEAMIPAGIAIFLAVNLPWYGTIYHRLGNEFIQGFFGEQFLKRGSTTLLGHGGGMFYYLPVLLAGMFPFSAAAVPAFYLAFKGNGAARRAEKRSRRLLFLCALASLLTIAVFSAASTKLPHYILPCFPFMAILAAAFCRGALHREGSPNWPGQLFLGLLLVMGLALAVAAVAAPFVLPLFWDKLDPSEYALPFSAPRLCLLPTLAGLSSAALAVAVLACHRRRSARGTALALCGGALLLGVFGTLLGIKGVETLQGPAMRMLGELKPRAGADTIVVSYGLWKPSFFFYLDRFVPRLYSKEQYAPHHEELKDMMRYKKPVAVLTRTRLRPDFAAVPGFVEIKTYGGYLLGGNHLAAERLKDLPPDKGP